MVNFDVHVIILLSNAISITLSYAESDYDKSKWIDPTDMLRDYSQQKKDMEKDRVLAEITDDESSTEDGAQNCTCENLNTCEKLQTVECSALQEELDKCEKQLQKLPAPETPFFRQYTANLLDRMRSFIPQAEIQDDMLVNVQMSLKPQSLRELRSFSEGKGKVQDAHSILIEMIQYVVEAEPLPDLLARSYDWIMENATIVCMFLITLAMVRIAMAVHVRYNMSWVSLIYKIIILAFIVSIPWNWWHLYKQEVAKRYADMLQEVPSDCKPKHQQTLWESLVRSVSLDVDECAKYHQRIMIDPFWEVPPTKALAVTITKFAVEPIEHIGGALNVFLQKTLNGLPVYLWPIAIFFSILMLLLTMVMAFGYRMNLFHMFGIEPPQQRSSMNDQILQDENNSLKEELANSKRKIQSLESQLCEATLALLPPSRPHASLAALQPTPPPYPMVLSASRPAPENLGFYHQATYSRGYDERDSGQLPELRRRQTQPAEHGETTECKYLSEEGSGDSTIDTVVKEVNASKEIKQYLIAEQQNQVASKLVREADGVSNSPLVGLALDVLSVEETIGDPSSRVSDHPHIVKRWEESAPTDQSENLLECSSNGFEVIEPSIEGKNRQLVPLYTADSNRRTGRDSSYLYTSEVSVLSADLEIRENSTGDQHGSITTDVVQQDRLSDVSDFAPPSHTAAIVESDPALIAQQPPLPTPPPSLQTRVENVGDEPS